LEQAVRVRGEEEGEGWMANWRRVWTQTKYRSPSSRSRPGTVTALAKVEPQASPAPGGVHREKEGEVETE
jgi:hypothetical protein